jgi:predicted small secreted protein
LEGDTVRNLLLIAAAVLVLAACNTIDGIGKDIKKAGESIEDAANRKK